MLSIDFNCDMGEGSGNDDLIMPWISSANIACGYHAGDETTMRETATLAILHNVAIGAHVSFNDRENFGRSEMRMPSLAVYQLVTRQLEIFQQIVHDAGAIMRHVKPHGALYNMSARDAELATVIAEAVRDFDSNLLFYGLSGSHSIAEAQHLKLVTVSEVFADRTYQDDGTLTPRSMPNALIDDAVLSVAQAIQMIETGTVTTVTGNTIEVIANSLCIHGDGKHAPGFAAELNKAIRARGILITPPSKVHE